MLRINFPLATLGFLMALPQILDSQDPAQQYSWNEIEGNFDLKQISDSLSRKYRLSRFNPNYTPKIKLLSATQLDAAWRKELGISRWPDLYKYEGGASSLLGYDNAQYYSKFYFPTLLTLSRDWVDPSSNDLILKNDKRTSEQWTWAIHSLLILRALSYELGIERVRKMALLPQQNLDGALAFRGNFAGVHHLILQDMLQTTNALRSQWVQPFAYSRLVQEAELLGIRSFQSYQGDEPNQRKWSEIITAFKENPTTTQSLRNLGVPRRDTLFGTRLDITEREDIHRDLSIMYAPAIERYLANTARLEFTRLRMGALALQNWIESNTPAREIERPLQGYRLETYGVQIQGDALYIAKFNKSYGGYWAIEFRDQFSADQMTEDIFNALKTQFKKNDIEPAVKIESDSWVSLFTHDRVEHDPQVAFDDQKDSLSGIVQKSNRLLIFFNIPISGEGNGDRYSNWALDKVLPDLRMSFIDIRNTMHSQNTGIQYGPIITDEDPKPLIRVEGNVNDAHRGEIERPSEYENEKERPYVDEIEDSEEDDDEATNPSAVE